MPSSNTGTSIFLPSVTSWSMAAAGEAMRVQRGRRGRRHSRWASRLRRAAVRAGLQLGHQPAAGPSPTAARALCPPHPPNQRRCDMTLEGKGPHLGGTHPSPPAAPSCPASSCTAPACPPPSSCPCPAGRRSRHVGPPGQQADRVGAAGWLLRVRRWEAGQPLGRRPAGQAGGPAQGGHGWQNPITQAAVCAHEQHSWRRQRRRASRCRAPAGPPSG